MKTKKILTLDGLRGYAALFVLWAHLPQVTNHFIGKLIYEIPSKLHLVYLGVDIFFVLSGFLITRILIKEKKKKTFSFKNFYIKRSLRLFPIYYLTIIIVGFFITWDSMSYVALYVSNYYYSFNLDPNPMRHTWSLGVEEQFYLLWPLIVYFFTIKQAKNIIGFLFPLIAIASAYYSFQVLDIELFENLLYRSTLYRILSLALGSYIAFNEELVLKNISKTSFYLVGFFLLAVFMNLLQLMPILILKMILSSLLSVYILIIVLRLDTIEHRIKILFTGKVIRFIGTISYGLYLYHYPILFYFNIHSGDKDTPVSFGFALLITSICFLVPIASYYLIEKPILRIKSKFD